MNKFLLAISLSIILVACSNNINNNNVDKIKDVELFKNELKTHPLILQSIEAHGGSRYDSAHYQFVFREITYRFQNLGENYIYEREGVIKGDTIHDLLKKGEFKRIKNGVEVSLSKEDAAKYGESVNSVIYFATLPHKLKDAAVIATELPKTEILNQSYQVLKVTFKQEGGGTDFDDEYFYWINSETKEVDFLAYNYQVNGGGVRFRSAYNKRRIGGILFQDYVNYKAPVETPLTKLPSLLEANKLIELSRIESEDIYVID
jgi:hypothetical protein